ncbi:MAG: helix-turn-helix domain-containing protein [Clostridia bacterium]|nr:helix-turn-helix domain-containing protein [Clostridia bacterium]
MSIGNTIKTLRRGADMTQEALAEHLCVSPQAISRWERDDALPDITQLGPLAHLFGVTTDYLLGVDVEKKKERVDAILAAAHEKGSRGYAAEAAEILREGLKQYPGEFALMNRLGDNLWHMSGNNAYTKEEREAFRTECIALKEKVLEGCTDNQIRNSAMQALCYLYPAVGKKERALELAYSMPFMVLSRQFLLVAVHDGDEQIHARCHLMSDLIQFLGNEIRRNLRNDEGKWIYSDDEMAALRDKVIAFYALMYENGDYGFYHDRLCEAHRGQAKYFAKCGEIEQALAHLDAAADSALRFDAYVACDDYPHTSLLFRGWHAGGGDSVYTDDPRSNAEHLLAFMADPVFDAIRTDSRFAEIAAKL